MDTKLRPGGAQNFCGKAKRNLVAIKMDFRDVAAVRWIDLNWPKIWFRCAGATRSN
jgi:hypothetical protein